MSSQIQNKLLGYEVQPPQGAWNNIATSLDENIFPSLSQKLYEYEEDPSLVAWRNIATQLHSDTHQKAKVVPFYIRYSRPLKYSGAIAIFIFLAVLSSLLISKKTESEIPASGIVQRSPIKKDSAKTPEDPRENSYAKREEKTGHERVIAKSQNSRSNRETSSTSNSFSFIENFLPQQAERNKMVQSSVDSDKYMIYSDEDGNVIRLPKKIFSAFACETEDAICKQRLQQLREKFAASATTADFTGLLQILRSLQENQ